MRSVRLILATASPGSGVIACLALCLALGAAALVRRPPVLPPPAQGHPVVDGNGHEVMVSAAPQRIMCYSPDLGSFLLVTGAGERLISVGGWNEKMNAAGPLPRMFPVLQRLHARPGDFAEPGLETLVWMRPDVLLDYAGVAARDVGVPSVDLNHMGKQHWYLDNARIFGDVLGRPDIAVERERRFEESLAAIRAELRPETLTDRPTVVELLSLDPGLVRGGGSGDSPQQRFLELAGAANGDALKRLGLNTEKLLRVDPDVILLSRLSSQTAAQFLADPTFRSLKAVRTRRVYTRPPGVVFTFVGVVEYPFFARWLAELLHPERMRPRLREIMREEYRRDSGYVVTDAELDQLLAVEANRDSSGYERFASPGAPGDRR